jgi:septum site-determining protein MinC
MPAAAPGNASSLFDLKSASLTLVSFVLKTGNIPALAQAMEAKFGDTPDFFSHDPVVIDLTPMGSLSIALDFPP